jgi:outer membrane immunogenic protein
MKQVAPAPPPCPTWSGFYVGINGGYKRADTDIDLTLLDDWNSPFDVVAKHEIEPQGTGDFLDTGGGELGGLVGYNFQFNNWVFGIEAAGDYLWLRESDTTGIFPVDFPGFPDVPYSIDTAFRTHYLATFGGRIGYALCRWMPYVTGGLAVGDVDFEQRIIQHPDAALGVSFFEEGNRESDTELGWMAGGGLEFALTDHWHLRAQYEYVDLGSESFIHDTTVPGFTGRTRIDLREHNASFALIFKF